MLLAEMAHRDGKLGGLVFISYSQPAIGEERRVAEDWAERNGYRLHVVFANIKGVHDKMAIGVGADGLRVLPGRNLVFIGHAVNVAKAIGCDQVWYGANADDRDYSDCTNDFLQAVNHLSEMDTGVSVAAPLIRMSKAQIIAKANQIGMNIDSAWSCYEPVTYMEPCGRCHSCEERHTK